MKAIVTARRSPLPSAPYHCMPTENVTSVTPASSRPCQAINPTNRGAIRGSFGSRGGRLITSGADGSRASAIAGKTSVIMLSHRTCRGPSGSGQPIMIAANTVAISARLHEKR